MINDSADARGSRWKSPKSPKPTLATAGKARAGTPALRPIVLVGMMGAGKSEMGKRLADRLGACNVDSDTLIEKRSGTSISAIFETAGEAAFRQLEFTVLEELLSWESCVISAGGGAFCHPRTHALIRHRAISIWLDVPAAVLCARLATDDSRPLLKTANWRERVHHLLAERLPAYRQADVRIDARGDPEHILTEVIAHLARCDPDWSRTI